MLPQILLVEDNETLGVVLQDYLQLKGMLVTWVVDGLKGWQAFESHHFDLCILDVMMPKMDGYTLGAKMKALRPDTPLIFLTAKSMKVDVLKGFNLGADDYIKKPIDEEELLARVKAVLGRSKPIIATQHGLISLGTYLFDYANQKLSLGHDARILTQREADLLHMLALNANKLTRRDAILKSLWGKSDYFNRKSMDVFITRLRKYLGADPALRIENVHGSGFILHMPVENQVDR